MTRTNAIVGITAALVLAAFAWWCIAPRDVAPNLDDTNTNAGAPASSPIDRPATTDRAAPDPTAPTDRTLAAANDASPVASNVLRVRLEGLDRDVPWQGPVHLHLEAQQRELFAFLGHDDRQKPDADGRCSFELPGWWSRSTDRTWRLDATSDGYHRAERHETTDLDPRDEIVLRVEASRSLHGRVIDDLGRPVRSASVIVFSTEALAANERGAGVEPQVGHTNTDDDGRWRATVPRDAEYAVVAEPPSWPDAGFDDFGELRDRPTLPRGEGTMVAASCAVNTNGRAVTNVSDLMLHSAVEVRGVVRWPDGVPVAQVPLHDLTTPFGALTLTAAGRTDAHGAFAMRMPAAGLTRLAIGDQNTTLVVGAPFELSIDVRAPVEIVLPEPTSIVALLGDRSVDATLEVETGAAGPCPAGEGVRVLATSGARVRAALGEHRSAWRRIGPGDRGARIALDLGASTMQPLVVLCGDLPKVTGVTIDWQHEDGRSERVVCRGDVGPQPLQTMLEPGRYEVIVTPMSNTAATKYLLPLRRVVDVGTSTVFVELERTTGGRLTVQVTANGVAEVPRNFEILDAQGSACGLGVGRRSPTLEPGNRWSGVLPPGDYEVVIRHAGHEPRRERATVREREVTSVHVRL